MENLIVMGTRDVKELRKYLKEQFGIDLSLKGAFFKSPRDRIYYVDKDVGDIDWKGLKVNSIGMYFAHIRDGMRLSIEGSQLLGPSATKGVLELTDKEADDWMAGIELEKDIEEKGYILIKHGNDFLGCGKAVIGKILNYVPKIRRVLIK